MTWKCVRDRFAFRSDLRPFWLTVKVNTALLTALVKCQPASVWACCGVWALCRTACPLRRETIDFSFFFFSSPLDNEAWPTWVLAWVRFASPPRWLSIQISDERVTTSNVYTQMWMSFRERETLTFLREGKRLSSNQEGWKREWETLGEISAAISRSSDWLNEALLHPGWGVFFGRFFWQFHIFRKATAAGTTSLQCLKRAIYNAVGPVFHRLDSLDLKPGNTKNVPCFRGILFTK